MLQSCSSSPHLLPDHRKDILLGGGCFDSTGGLERRSSDCSHRVPLAQMESRCRTALGVDGSVSRSPACSSLARASLAMVSPSWAGQGNASGPAGRPLFSAFGQGSMRTKTASHGSLPTWLREHVSIWGGFPFAGSVYLCVCVDEGFSPRSLFHCLAHVRFPTRRHWLGTSLKQFCISAAPLTLT